MLESGCVSVKNEVNIMMKNIVDIVLGGFTYWLFGYGMSFGRGPLSNPFIAIGDFLLDPPAGDPLMGPIFGTPSGAYFSPNVNSNRAANIFHMEFFQRHG